ncbi:MAG: UTP--glucose-1-phosphate uridylyltransferase [Candidatus Bruticola sp.]
MPASSVCGNYFIESENFAVTLNFMPFALKMRGAGVSDLQTEAFRHNCMKAFNGKGCFIEEKDIAPVGSLPSLKDLPVLTVQKRDELLKKCAIIKLNGGLATTMGMEGGPKSLIRAHGSYSFLDLTVRHILDLRKSLGHGSLPLILMNSFNTSAQTMKSLMSYLGLLEQPVAVEIVQSKVPRISAADLLPYASASEPQEEWCPPGHGDLYLSLFISGLLVELLSRGIKYIFVSNIDNLGASLDMRIPEWMAAQGCPMVMEVSRRCAADRKGGHLARDVYGSFVLRESSMCRPEERDSFADTQKYCYFNTNNLWFDAEALYKLIISHGGLLDLPVICNTKMLYDSFRKACKVYQIETACGSIISSWPKAQALEVPRSRFIPVKGLSDLMIIRSDLFSVGSDYSIRCVHDDFMPPFVSLPSEIVTLEDFEQMLPAGVPSLLRCSSLKIDGPVVFGKGVSCQGEVKITASAEAFIPDGTLLSGEVNF